MKDDYVDNKTTEPPSCSGANRDMSTNSGSATSFEDSLRAIIDAVVGERKEEAIKSLLYEHFVSNKSHFKNIGDIELMTRSNYDSILEHVIRAIHGYSDHRVIDVIINWRFFEQHLTRFFEQFEGSFACADKASCILKKYVTYIETSEITELNPQDKKNYHHPQKGDATEWMNFVDSLVHLRHGNPRTYFLIYMNMIALYQ